MRIPATLKSEIAYSRNVLGAGLDAVTAVRRDSPNQTIAPEFARAARGACGPAVIGAAIGVLCVCAAQKSKPGRGALVGGLLGLGAGVAWGSRKTTAAIARQAARNLATVSDAHWLEKNPIAYA